MSHPAPKSAFLRSAKGRLTITSSPRTWLVPKPGEQGIDRQRYRLVCDYRNLDGLDLNLGRALRARLVPSSQPEASSSSPLADATPHVPLDRYSWLLLEGEAYLNRSAKPVPRGLSTERKCDTCTTLSTLVGFCSVKTCCCHNLGQGTIR